MCSKGNKMIGRFLFLEILVAGIPLFGAHVCPVQNATDKPQFTKKLGSEDWVRYDSEIALWCCAEGYDAIKWYRQVEGTSGWESFPPSSTGDSDAPEVQEDGQILRIYKATKQDEATYRCDLVKQSTVNLTHDTVLYVIECDPLNRPIATKPFPQNPTIDEFGRNVIIDCTGYFGCDDNVNMGLDFVVWRVAGKFDQINISNISTRYQVTTTTRIDQAIKQATLTITDVQEVDTERSFVCSIFNPGGQTDLAVKITKIEKPNWPWIVLGVGLGVCVIIIIIIVVCCLYWPRIILFVNSRWPSCGPKFINDEKIKYNLFIHHATAVHDEDLAVHDEDLAVHDQDLAVHDQDIAEELKKQLNDIGYKVFITSDIGGNQPLVKTFFEKTAESASVFFLYSENLVEEELADFLLQTVIADRNGKGIVFLELDKFELKKVMDWAVKAKVPNAERIDATGENIKFVLKEQVNENGKKNINDLKFWKVLPRVKVPSRQSWKWTNFLCTLQNKIPKFQDQVQIKNRPEQTPKKPEHMKNGENPVACPPVSPKEQDNSEVSIEFVKTTDIDQMITHPGFDKSLRENKVKEYGETSIIQG